MQLTIRMKQAPRGRTLTAWLATLLLLQLALLVAAPGLAAASGSADTSFAAGAFRKVWERPDLPVAQQKASRSFTWGPEGWAFGFEPYQESPDNKRLVQYFDKTRMEITNPAGDAANRFYVTNGLLVKEMVAGQVQEGNTRFRPSAPSEVPVAGDAVNNPGPTYRSFAGVASLNLDNKVPRQSGEIVKAAIDREGKVAESNALGDRYKVKNLEYNPELSHNIPDVFWNFMTQQGTVYDGGQFPRQTVLDWVQALGFPLTEAYWTRVVVAGQNRDVLIQLYERRVLTFTPDNPEAFRVEMGNVGAHYYAWRYPNQPRQAPWAKVKLINGTDCNQISFAFTGQDNLTIEIARNSDKTYKFGPGKYKYRVTGCNYTPYETDVTYEGGKDYEEEISVR